MNPILFVTKRFNFKDIEGLIGASLIICLDAESQDFLIKKNIASKCVLDYYSKNFWEEASQDSITWVDDWANKKIFNGKSIKQEFVYKENSLWWFGRNILFSTGGGILDLISFINLCHQILRI